MNDNGITLLGISGSSRLKATHFAVNEALRYAHEQYGVTVDSFSAHRKTIGFCVHCDACVRKKQGCAFKDDMEDLYPRLVRADAWILGTPVYQGQVSAQLKAMMDRYARGRRRRSPGLPRQGRSCASPSAATAAAGRSRRSWRSPGSISSTR